MSEKVLMVAVCCATALILGTEGFLAWIALTHDGPNEGLIVTALIGIPTIIFGLVGTVGGFHLGAQNTIQASQSSAQSTVQAAKEVGPSQLGGEAHV